MAVAARAVAVTSTTTTNLQNLIAVIAHFTTMAATDSITITKSSDTGIIAKLQPAANNQTVSASFTVPVRANDVVSSDTVKVNFNGTAAGTVTVIGF